MDHDEILHQHPPQSQKISTTANADEVIISSATDLVCDISSISINARYLYPEVDKDLIPGKLSQIGADWAIKKCFDIKCCLRRIFLIQMQLAFILSC